MLPSLVFFYRDLSLYNMFYVSNSEIFRYYEAQQQSLPSGMLAIKQ